MLPLILVLVVLVTTTMMCLIITTIQIPPLKNILTQLDLHLSINLLHNFFWGKAKCIVISLVLMMSYETSLRMVSDFLWIRKAWSLMEKACLMPRKRLEESIVEFVVFWLRCFLTQTIPKLLINLLLRASLNHSAQPMKEINK